MSENIKMLLVHTIGGWARNLENQVAVTATAHKLARLIYSMLKNGTEYTDKGIEYYELQYKQKVLKNVKKKAKTLGFKLVEVIEKDSQNTAEISRC